MNNSIWPSGSVKTVTDTEHELCQTPLSPLIVQVADRVQFSRPGEWVAADGAQENYLIG